MVVLREAIERTGFDWSREGATMQEALIAIVYATGRPVKRNAKATASGWISSK